MSNIIDFNAHRKTDNTQPPAGPNRHLVPIFYVLEAAAKMAALPNINPAWRELAAQALAYDDGRGLCELDDQQYEWFTQA